MKLPSLSQLIKNASDTFARFPFAIFSAIVGTGAVLVIIQNDIYAYKEIEWLNNICAVAFLGISVFTASQLIAERENWKFGLSLGIKLILTCLFVLYYFLLPQNIFQSESVHIIRYLLFALAAHLFVAIAPFKEKGHIAGFWEFNKSLFLRFVTAALYSGVLYAGLAIALAAIQNLFNVDIKSERYIQLWWFISGIFNTWFFLSGVPARSDIANDNINYPKGLKIFTQYVLIPLVVVYVCILYAYMGKIIIEWDWPKGWVGYLVLGFSITGIFSLLLIHPIKEFSENKWIAVVWRWFYIVLIPLTVLLLLAIWRRISEYGITENRYFVVVLGFWLAAIALYFLLSKTKSIKVIPISLCIIALLASFGPWGAFSISESGQLKRLEEVLLKNNLLVNNKAQKAESEVSFADSKQISSIISYLVRTHGTGSLQPWFEERLDTVQTEGRINRWNKMQKNAEDITKILGVRYVHEYEREENEEQSRFYSFHSDSQNVVQLKEYRYLIQGINLSCTKEINAMQIGTDTWSISLISDSLQVLYLHSSKTAENISIDLTERLFSLYKNHGTNEYGSIEVPNDLLIFDKTSGTLRLKVFIQDLSINVKGRKICSAGMKMDILMAAGDGQK
ncbi:MAG: DUF4153 domain-containing protein [Bacteroidetes bacterium]|nr:DUF4153 domain-containing protein [Bacteroidota bacterium]